MQTPLAEQPRIVLIGVRNAGKSSLMNALFEKQISIVSDTPGTTTDPVTRSFEIPGLGPAGIVDTAGIDDMGDVGLQRVRSTLERYRSADMILFISSALQAPTPVEQELFHTLFKKESGTRPVLLVLTHAQGDLHPEKHRWTHETRAFLIDSPTRSGISTLIEALAQHRPAPEGAPLDGLVEPGDVILLVVPIDAAAPKGRIILPQVEVIRDALDKGCATLVTQADTLGTFYGTLRTRPRLVITDSQAFHTVAAALPDDQPLTSFSILFARKKGDLTQYLEGLRALDALPSDPNILVLESCSHHRQPDDDIGTVKIPHLLRTKKCPRAEFTHVRQLPSRDELKRYDMIIQCASCMVTRGKVMARLDRIAELEIPVTNYGMFLAWAHGLFPRAVEMIP